MTKIVVGAVLAAALAAGTGQAAGSPGAAVPGAAAAAASQGCAATGTAGIAGPAGSRVDVLGSLAQVLPRRHQDGAAGARLCQARNGFDSFQIEVSAPTAGAISQVSVTTSALQGPGATIAATNVRLYREDYTTIRTLTDGELASTLPRSADGTCQGDCRFPDALIPDVDVTYHQKRKAFPFAVPAGENRMVWVDVQVPSGQKPGAYAGAVTVTVGTTDVRVPIALQVNAATLPSTSSLGGAYLASLGGGRVPSAEAYKVMAEIGLNNRVTIAPNAPEPSSLIDSTFRSLLSGTDPNVLLPGAALTDLPVQTTWARDSVDAYVTFLRNAGLLAKGFAYCDEVSESSCENAYVTSGATADGLPIVPIDNAQTGWPKPDTAGPTAMVPGGLATNTKGLITVTNYLPQYLAGLAGWRAASPGRRVWAYTSCMSGGCWDPANGAKYTPETYWNGWASYGIDQPASEQRALGWQAFEFGVDGELYYDVTSATGIWNDPFNYGLNGDGTLFYPFDPARVGGTSWIPVESIRLKRIRDGRQDYELLKIVGSRGSAAQSQAVAVAHDLFPAWNQAGVGTASFDAGRQRLMDLVSGGAQSTVAAADDLDCNGHPDVLGVAAGSGDLVLFGRGATDWLPNVPTHVGTGYLSGGRPTSSSLVLPGDVDGDGKPDLISASSNGTLQLRRGTCTGTFTAPTALAVTASQPVPVGDFSGDGRVDLLDQRADGTLVMLAGNGAGGFAAATRVGGGWGGLEITAPSDVDGDGWVDLLARRSDGVVLLYAGDGHGGWKTSTGVATGLTLSVADFPTLLGLGDVDGDGRADLVSIDRAGEMALRAGNGAGGFAAPRRIGGGWVPGNIVQIAR